MPPACSCQRVLRSIARSSVSRSRWAKPERLVSVSPDNRQLVILCSSPRSCDRCARCCSSPCCCIMSKPAPNLPSEVSILNSKKSAKKGLDATQTEVIWPKPEFVRPNQTGLMRRAPTRRSTSSLRPGKRRAGSSSLLDRCLAWGESEVVELNQCGDSRQDGAMLLNRLLLLECFSALARPGLSAGLRLGLYVLGGFACG